MSRDAVRTLVYVKRDPVGTLVYVKRDSAGTLNYSCLCKERHFWDSELKPFMSRNTLLGLWFMSSESLLGL